MTRIIACLVTSIALVASIHPAVAQSIVTAHKIGYLAAGSAKSYKQRLTAFRQGLKALGYFDGKNIVIVERYAKGQRKHLPALAAQLVALPVDMIVTNGGTSTLAADRC